MAILWFTRTLLNDQLTRRGWIFVYAATVASASVFWNFWYSHIELLLAALGLGACVLHVRGKRVAACLLVMVAGLLKLYPWVLLPWFVWRGGSSAQARARCMALPAALAVLAVLATGLGLWKDFFASGARVALGSQINCSFHYSLPALVINWALAGHGFQPTPEAARLWWCAGTLVGLVLIALGYLVCFWGAGDSETEFCLLSVAMVAGTVSASGYYLVWLIFPTVAMLTRIMQDPSLRRMGWFGVLVVLMNIQATFDGPFLNRHIYLKILSNNLPLFGLLGMGMLLGRQYISEQ